MKKEDEKAGERVARHDEIPQIILFKERGRDRTLRNEYKWRASRQPRPFGARDKIRKGALEAKQPLSPSSSRPRRRVYTRGGFH